MRTENTWIDTTALDTLYRVYGRAVQELQEHAEESTWEGSDDDMLVLATCILDLAFLGEGDPIQLRRGAMHQFGYVEACNAVPQGKP